jgi:hypothetical protein
MMTREVVAVCERLFAMETHQCWLWSALGIAKRRGGAMIASGDVEAVARYREGVAVVVEVLFGSGGAIVCCIGEGVALRLREAFEQTAFVIRLAAENRRGVDCHVSEVEAQALVQLRRVTQRVVDSLLALVRTEQELPLNERGGETSGHV